MSQTSKGQSEFEQKLQEIGAKHAHMIQPRKNTDHVPLKEFRLADEPTKEMLTDPEGQQLVQAIHDRKRIEEIAERLQSAQHHVVPAFMIPTVDVAYLLAELRKRQAALDAALVLAEEWRYKGEHGWGAWQEGHGPGPDGYILDGASADLRAAIADQLEGTNDGA